MPESCAGCRFFRPFVGEVMRDAMGGLDPKGHRLGPVGTGHCRYGPPDPRFGWPGVPNDGWCRGFEPQEPPTPDPLPPGPAYRAGFNDGRRFADNWWRGKMIQREHLWTICMSKGALEEAEAAFLKREKEANDAK